MTNDYELLIELIKSAQGERSLNQFALHCGISAGHLSRLINGKFSTPPSPQILKKIASHAYNNVTYDSLMKASRYYVTTVSENTCSVNEPIETYNSDTLQKENDLIEKLSSSPEIQLFCNELLAAPEEKLNQIISIWQIIK